MSRGPVVALVPARSGSKAIPQKNLVDLHGYPLLAYSVRAGLAAMTIDRTIVTTDSEEIAEVGRAHGAEVPFLRPPELARDHSLDIDYVLHALKWLKEHEGVEPELVVQLRPTTPLRDPTRLDDAVQTMKEVAEASGLRSVHRLPEPPQKMLGISEGGWLTGLFPYDARPEYYNLPRQAFPPAYWPNGYVDVIRPEVALAGGGLYGAAVRAFLIPVTVEIDTPDELDYLRYQLGESGHPLVDELRKSAANG